MARIFIFCLLFFSSINTSLASIVSIRLGQQPNDVTRIVLDSDENIDFKLFPLLNPHRLVVDIQSADLKLNKNNTQLSKGVVHNIRWGKYENQSRIVLELKDEVQVINSFSLPPSSGFPWRLVIDIKGKKTDETVFSDDDDNTIKKQPKPTIIIDPGHGGKDPGAIGTTGVYEKNITLAMALELRKALENTGKYKVVMTRTTDKYLYLNQRVNIARKNSGNLFISIHADSAPNKNARGLSVYTLSDTASDKEAKMLAERENKADYISGIDFETNSPEINDILVDLTQRETNNSSSSLAEYLVDDLHKNIKVKKDPHRYAGFAVLKAYDIPSVLIEIGYLSNAYDEKLIKQQAYRQKLAVSITQSINKFFHDRNGKNNFE